jgi:Leucine-rich repeat (LRR) protein
MTGAAVGRELECTYYERFTPTLLSSQLQCFNFHVDFSAKFESEKHSFPHSLSFKSDIKTFEIRESPQVDFIPLDVLTEFPNLSGLGISDCKLPTLKSGLFKTEFEKIEYLNLYGNKIELIEPEAFQHLINLKWTRLCDNKIKTLPDRLFNNNPDLIYIDLKYNKITSVHPNFFDGLEKLKLVEFDENLCIDAKIGCSTCLITQSDLKAKLQNCHNSYLAQGPAQTEENTSENPSSKNQLSGIAKALRNSLESLTRK